MKEMGETLVRPSFLESKGSSARRQPRSEKIQALIDKYEGKDDSLVHALHAINKEDMHNMESTLHDPFAEAATGRGLKDDLGDDSDSDAKSVGSVSAWFMSGLGRRLLVMLV